MTIPDTEICADYQFLILLPHLLWTSLQASWVQVCGGDVEAGRFQYAISSYTEARGLR